MIAYVHAIIAHGKGLAECMSLCLPFSDSRTRITYNYIGD
jgi:hypothetical protein